MKDPRPGPSRTAGRGEAEYRERIRGEAEFWDERTAALVASGRIPLWFDHRRGEDVTFIPLSELKGAGIRANPVLYRAVYGKIIDRLLRAASRTRGTALDLGCGAGWFSLELARLGMSVDGFYISPGQIEVAKRLSRESEQSADPRLHGDFGRTNYRVADLNSIRLDEGQYDVAVSLGTLHHVQRLDDLLREVRRSLRPGGKFLFWEFVGYRGAARLFPALFKAAGTLAAGPRRLFGRQQGELKASPFEGVSTPWILQVLRRDYVVESLESWFLFLPVVITRLGIYRLPRTVSLPLVKILGAVDWSLVHSGLFPGPYVLGVARKA